MKKKKKTSYYSQATGWIPTILLGLFQGLEQLCPEIASYQLTLGHRRTVKDLSQRRSIQQVDP